MSDEFFRARKPHQVNEDVVPHGEEFQDLDAGPQITGNVPPELLQRLKKRKQQLDSGEAQPNFKPPAAPSLQQFVPNMSSDLQALLAVLKSQSGIYEEIKLPSLGRFYNGMDGPNDGKLHIRPMTGEEEEILATQRYVKRGKAVNMIFEKCIQENFKPENLLSVDRTFLLIYLRGISYGVEYEVEVRDPETDRKFNTTIDLDSLEIEFCPDNYGPVLSDKLPRSGFDVEYRLSRGSDEIALQEYRERKLKQGSDAHADDSLIFRTAQLINSIQGVTDKYELQLLIKNLPIQDVSYLRNLVSEPPFGISTKVSILSPVSSEEFEVELPLEANFFFPRGRKKENSTQA